MSNTLGGAKNNCSLNTLLLDECIDFLKKKFFFGCTMRHEDPSSQPGIKPKPPALEAQSPNRWTTRKVPESILKIS